MTKRPARLEDRYGQTLKGVVIEPDSGQYNRDLGFVYLPGVVMGVTAVHTIGFKLAERLADVDGWLYFIAEVPGYPLKPTWLWRGKAEQVRGTDLRGGPLLSARRRLC